MMNNSGGEIKLTKDDINNMLMEMDELKRSINALNQEIKLFDTIINENMEALELLHKLNEGSNLNDILVPIGGDVFINASITDVSKVVVHIGSHVFSEITPGKTIEFIEKRLEALNTQKSKERGQLAEVENRYNDMAQFIQSISQRSS
ncbi:MAG: prefoldin subunit alpha [Candidatus Thermoplasmatota archaeon]|jgi:prefoldin alpha subunit|nr:prefoldin subunit alpha [Candidatus Thermoplasmatota archaeon]MCL5963162.1 prefoldin subunit alpha [Candidatus Thermoplasmatota archaeon]